MQRIIILVLLLSALCGFCQKDPALTAARRYTEKGLFHEAQEKYLEVLKKYPDHKEAGVEYTDLLFMNLQDYEGAYHFILKTIVPGTDTTLIQYYGLAKCEHYLENYKSAKYHYRKGLKLIDDDEFYAELQKEIEISLRNVEFAEAHHGILHFKRYKVLNAGRTINSKYDEYVPVTDDAENFLMFTSRRKNQHNTKPDFHEEKYAEDMYISKRTGGHFSEPELLPAAMSSGKELKNTKRNESLVSLSHDGKTLFLFKQGTLWKSVLENGNWSAPVKMEEKIISNEYHNHISITADGKTVYFTAEDRGGFGGLDIFRSSKKQDGSWSEPENLGPRFNTAGNEQGPFISDDGQTLYFASDRRDGFGGYDIYVSVIENGEWLEPQNMGRPINSTADDIFIFPKKGFSKGFFTSNRRGGYGGYDIYRFYDVDKPDFEKDQIASERVIINREELKAAVKEKLGKNLSRHLFIRIKDTLVTQDTSVLFASLAPDTNTHVDLQHVLECDTCLFRKDEIALYSVLPPEKETVPADTVTPVKPPDEFDAFAVYFDTDKSDVSKYSEQLGKLAEWLKADENRQVNISGFADSRGSLSHNLVLSQRRADAVKKFLLASGIKKSQIVSSSGKGEVSDGQETEEAWKLNRRADIVPVTKPVT